MTRHVIREESFIKIPPSQLEKDLVYRHGTLELRRRMQEGTLPVEIYNDRLRRLCRRVFYANDESGTVFIVAIESMGDAGNNRRSQPYENSQYCI